MSDRGASLEHGTPLTPGEFALDPAGWGAEAALVILAGCIITIPGASDRSLAATTPPVVAAHTPAPLVRRGRPGSERPRTAARS